MNSLLRTSILATRRAMPLASTATRSLSSGASNNLVEVEMKDNSVAVLTMKSLPVNSLSTNLLNEITDGIKSVEVDTSYQGLVITSASKNVFSAGLDLTEFYRKDEEYVANFWRAVQNMFMALYGSRLATVAAINGHSPAGGCMISMACDYRVAPDSEKFTIGLNEAAFGLVAPFWFIPPFENLVGPRQAERMLCRGELVPMTKALDIGLVDELVSQDQVVDRALQEAALMVTCAVPSSRVLTKMSLRGASIKELQDRQEEDVVWFTQTVMSDRVQNMLHQYMESLKNKSKK